MQVLLVSLIALGLTGCGHPDAPPENASRTDAGVAAAGPRTSSGGEEGGASSGDFAGPYAPLDRIPVAHGDRRMPPGCGPRQAVGLMTHFVAAFNEGDEPKLRRLFSSGATLTPWLYSVNRGSEVEFSTDTLEDLIGYFAERRRKNDRLELVSVAVRSSNASSGEAAYADLTYSMNRRADDLQAGPGSGRRTEGKSVLDCRRQVLVVTSLETLS